MTFSSSEKEWTAEDEISLRTRITIERFHSYDLEKWFR